MSIARIIIRVFSIRFSGINSFLLRMTNSKPKMKVLSNETYGRDSRIYVSLESKEERRRIERLLRCNFNITTIHSYGVPTLIEISVTCFKGAGHWE